MPRWGWTVVLILGQGCAGSLSYTVDEDLIKRLPKASRRSVFQAETVVTIAIDRKSTVKRTIDNTEREIDRIREKIRELEERQEYGSASEGKRIGREIQMYETKIDYLEEVIEHEEVRQELAEKELLLAKAQFELEKVRLVKSHSIAFDGDEEDFVDQVKTYQQDVDEFRRDVEKDAARLKREEEKWLAVKKRFYSSFGESSKGWWTE